MPVIPDAFHRSVVYNSRPTNLADLPVSRGVFARLITVTAADTDVCSIIDRVIAKDAPDTSFTRK
jgi:hypothetical protein